MQRTWCLKDVFDIVGQEVVLMNKFFVALEVALIDMIKAAPHILPSFTLLRQWPAFPLEYADSYACTHACLYHGVYIAARTMECVAFCCGIHYSSMGFTHFSCIL